MGNRATVIFTDGKGRYSPAVYLHWNGGPESVYGFLEELDRRKIRADQDYECARFIQIAGEHFDQDSISGLCLGVANGPASDSPEDLGKVQTDLGDNGIYLVNRTGDKMQVRRFTERWNPDNRTIMFETDAALVEAEMAQASQHEYRPHFREFYAQLTALKPIKDNS